jgi:molybdopterin molybdotransferase
LDAAYAALGELLTPIEGREQVSLMSAAGRVTYGPVLSSIPLPGTDNSAVDGYGIAEEDLVAIRRPLSVTGRVVAGDRRPSERLRAGEALYLATGASIPDGVAAVVMHEHVTRRDDRIFLDEPVRPSSNIRRVGEDVAAGTTVVSDGTVMDYRHIALLAACGVGRVTVRRRVRVALFASGNELTSVGESLRDGSVYDANTPMLSALLARPSIDVVRREAVIDDEQAAVNAYRRSTDTDLILSTGGAAGSETDHTSSAIRNAGGVVTSLRLALRPGRPIVAGRIGSTVCVGLPGNPTAAMVAFLLFARPVILALCGLELKRPVGVRVVSGESFSLKSGRTEFAPGRIVGLDTMGRPVAQRLGRGGSARLLPLVQADGLLELHSATGEVREGDPVDFHPFTIPFSSA